MATESGDKIRLAGGIGHYLDELLALATPEKIEELRSVLGRSELDLDALLALVSKEALGWAITFSFPMGREDVLGKLPEEFRGKAQSVVELLQGELAFLVSDRRLLGLEDHPDRAETVAPPRETFRAISGLTSFSSVRFLEREGGVSAAPFIRLVFLGHKNDTILDSLLDWDDLALLVVRLTRVFDGELSLLDRVEGIAWVIPADELVRIERSIEESLRTLEGIKEKFGRIRERVER